MKSKGQSEVKAQNRAVMLFICGALLLLFLAVGLVRWHDIKGTFLIEPATLSSVQGRIVSSKIEYRSGGKGGGGWHYAIVYEFKVEGRKYQSDEVTFSYTSTRDIEFARKYAKKYPAGAEVRVYHEKGKPSFSVLEPGEKDAGLIFIPVAVAFFTVLFIWAFFWEG
ncbi:MAG: hypothetical protein CVV64_20595 [Candidatus Wallbacteria bacterium HGW-Wallbacteria-1]|jgi:hypothetical protein|uniref:DUF3592 domain-containing protein n=1 Tax=Candidatus Wallbacteria bacterium HGW-Wallbacteria-1 TaxID=2013854 RepID=A0A2N1PI91_9BACT|nr:MAG: hypothetical protein CVV64_20595 [Candidatus Wallbacteria bacterium HGW-Wallbacteria-1]